MCERSFCRFSCFFKVNRTNSCEVCGRGIPRLHLETTTWDIGTDVLNDADCNVFLLIHIICAYSWRSYYKLPLLIFWKQDTKYEKYGLQVALTIAFLKVEQLIRSIYHRRSFIISWITIWYNKIILNERIRKRAWCLILLYRPSKRDWKTILEFYLFDHIQ